MYVCMCVCVYVYHDLGHVYICWASYTYGRCNIRTPHKDTHVCMHVCMYVCMYVCMQRATLQVVAAYCRDYNKAVSGGGGGRGRTCAAEYHEPRPVFMSLTTTH